MIRAARIPDVAKRLGNTQPGDGATLLRAEVIRS
jgi:hypothetical protein